MQDSVQRAFHVKRLTDVVLEELERRVAAEVRNVVSGAGTQFAAADDLPLVGQQPLAKVRPQEARPASHDGTGRQVSAATDAAVDEAAIPHCLRVEDIAPIDDHGTAHQTLDAIEVELAKLIPLGHDQ